MSGSLEDIERQVRTLSAEDRAKLAEVLLESLGTRTADVESAWEREIEERVAAYDRGDALTFSAEDVFAEARHLSK